MPSYSYTLAGTPSAYGGGAGSFAGLAHEPDHSGYGLAQLLEQYAESTRLRAILDILLDGEATIGLTTGPTGVQSIEDLAWELYTERGIVAVEGGGPAVGVQLDIIGAIVGLPRLGAFGGSDAVYRAALGVQIAANRSDGRWPDVLHLFDLAGVTEPVGSCEYFPATMRTEATGLTSSTWAAAVWGVMRRGKPAGVRWDFVWSTSTEADVFALSSQLATDDADVARGTADLAGATGGLLAGSFTS